MEHRHRIDAVEDRQHHQRVEQNLLAARQVEDVLERPVEVVGDVGYLLVELVERVAYDSPVVDTSASKLLLQDGQVTVSLGASGWLIWV